MTETYTNEGTTIKGDRIIGEARKIYDIQVIVKSGRHKAQRVILKDNACVRLLKNINLLNKYS